MDNTGNHNKSWSEADIRMYLNGELSSREMHELERASLDDPFLADALEGFVDSAPPDSDMDDLRKRLAARVDKTERRVAAGWFRRPAFRVAAAVIGLAGIGLTTWYTLLKQQAPHGNADVAKTVVATAPRAQQSPPLADSIDLQTDTTAVAISSGLVAKADKEVLPADRRAKRRAAASQPEETAEKARSGNSDIASQSVQAADSSLVSRDITSNALSPKAAPPSDARANAFRKVQMDTLELHKNAAAEMMRSTFKPVQQPLLLSGRVVDLNNRPLSGASVFLNNAPKYGTTTDAYGNFNFRIHSLDTSQQMTVALVGYKQTLVPLNTNALTNNLIRLEEAKANLDEVVVTGFGAKRRETRAAAPSEDPGEHLDSIGQKVIPVIGRSAYRQYLDTAKLSLKLDSAIFGTERVSFQVDQKGQITEFKIEQSLSPAHDAGLIQLITTGPSWRLVRGRKARALVSLNFP